MTVTTGGWAHYLVGSLQNVPAEFNEKLITVTNKAGNPRFYARTGGLPTLSLSDEAPIGDLPRESSEVFVKSSSSNVYVSVYAPCCVDARATIEIQYAQKAEASCRDKTTRVGDVWKDSSSGGCEMYNARLCAVSESLAVGGLAAKEVVSWCVAMCLLC